MPEKKRQEVRMLATCQRVEYRSLTEHDGITGTIRRLLLVADLNGAAVTIDVSGSFRRQLGMLRADRRHAIQQTMPPTVEINSGRQSKGRMIYTVIREDLEHWARQAEEYVAAHAPAPVFPSLI